MGMKIRGSVPRIVFLRLQARRSPMRRAFFMPVLPPENQSEPAMPIVLHRVLPPTRRAILKRAQGNAYQGSRVSSFGGLRLPEVLGHARTCQFIAGDPRTDASMCGAGARVGSSYCAEHHGICYDRVVDLKRSEAGRKAWETRQRRHGTPGAPEPAW